MADITILISTSLIPTCPSTKIIDETIEAIRAQLPDSTILLGADGLNEPNTSYIRYCTELMTRYDNTRTYVFDRPVHQTGMMERWLPDVATPLVYFLEHDWVTLPNVPWKQLSELILSGEYNYIKLHAAPRINPYHEHMMRERMIYQWAGNLALRLKSDRYQDAVGGDALPLIHTVQFSANPHLASTEWYRRLQRDYLAGKLDFTENVVHGIIGASNWEDHRMAIFNPVDGDMMRCRHTDGRGTNG
jgi:hypothetical protein